MSAVTIPAPSGQVLAAIERWHGFMRGDDPAAIGFAAPFGPSFPYVTHLASGDTAMLEFETEMAGKYVNGADIIRVDDSGRIVEFRATVRPLQALNTVHQLMGAELVDMGSRT